MFLALKNKKIADCLSSIDEVIAIKKQKLETWENIKKGYYNRCLYKVKDMARPKKDGRYLNCYLENQVLIRLEKYCVDTGLTKTNAIERILSKFFDQNDKQNKSEKL